jgi:hypothetical protein
MGMVSAFSLPEWALSLTRPSLAATLHGDRDDVLLMLSDGPLTEHVAALRVTVGAVRRAAPTLPIVGATTTQDLMEPLR